MVLGCDCYRSLPIPIHPGGGDPVDCLGRPHVTWREYLAALTIARDLTRLLEAYMAELIRNVWLVLDNPATDSA